MEDDVLITIPNGVQDLIQVGTGQRIGRNFVYDLINSGQLKAFKMGRRTVTTGRFWNEYIQNLPAYRGEEA